MERLYCEKVSLLLALKMERTIWQRMQVSSPQLTASKEMRMTVLQLQETKFCHNGMGFNKAAELSMRTQPFGQLDLGPGIP